MRSSEEASSAQDTCDEESAVKSETSEMFLETCASFGESVDHCSDPVAHLLRHRSSFESEGRLESSSLLSDA